MGVLSAATRSMMLQQRRRAFNSWLAHALARANVRTMLGRCLAVELTHALTAWLAFVDARKTAMRAFRVGGVGRALNAWVAMVERARQVEDDQRMMTRFVTALGNRSLRKSLNSWVRAAIGASIQTAQGQAHSYASNLVGNLRTKSRAVKIWRQSISVNGVEARAVEKRENRTARIAYKIWAGLLLMGGYTAALRTERAALLEEVYAIEGEWIAAVDDARQGRAHCQQLQEECVELTARCEKMHRDMLRFKDKKMASFRRPTVASILATSAVSATANGADLIAKVEAGLEMVKAAAHVAEEATWQAHGHASSAGGAVLRGRPRNSSCHSTQNPPPPKPKQPLNASSITGLWLGGGNPAAPPASHGSGHGASHSVSFDAQARFPSDSDSEASTEGDKSPPRPSLRAGRRPSLGQTLLR
mmetsp:Transcript_60642/g.180373  ORF Transcript_60642/g.180373 Transcript_60642/m.180373 type:complete len:417 (-) Transcript_60642:115-1365(-)